MKNRSMVIGVMGVLLTIVGMAHAQQIVISTFPKKNPTMDIAEKVMIEAYKRIGLTMVIKQLPGERAIVTANYGDVDGELFRKEGMEQSFPNLLRIPVAISVADFVVFTKDKQFPVDGWKSLLPYRVGYVLGIKAIEMNLVDGTKSEVVKTYEQAFRKLEFGRSDVVVTERSAGLEKLKEIGLKGIDILEPPLVTIKSFHYLHVKNQHLIEPLTAVLQQMKEEGIIQNIQEQATPN